MEKARLFCWVFLALVSGRNIQGQYQAYTVQDIADLQNTVLYEMFDYFYFAQEQQLTTVFERLAEAENRLQQILDAMGINTVEEPDENDIVRPTQPPTTLPPPVRQTYPPFLPPVRPPVQPERPRPKKPKKNPRPTPPPTTTRPTTQPTTQPTTIPTTIATTTPAPTPAPFVTNCAEVLRQGLFSEDQAFYSIDPLRKFKLVTVMCEKEIQPDGSVKMLTVVGHSAMRSKKVTGFENPGEFSLSPEYNATLKQLRAITKGASACSQFIEYRCRGAVLLSAAREGGTYGYWRDINGESVESWGGAPTNSGMCACGVEGNCVNPALGCNCDANPKTFMTDSGFITDKDRLPVLDVRLGDTGGKKETGYIKLGPLKCE